MDAEQLLAGRIKERREACGWSQEEVGRQMNALGFRWWQSTVAKTEASARPIRVNEAAALATIFDTTILALTAPDASPLDLRIETTRRALYETKKQIANHEYMRGTLQKQLEALEGRNSTREEERNGRARSS